jgi:large repetitive protein
MNRILPKFWTAMSLVLCLSRLLSAQTPATLSLSASANPSTFGQPVTLSASVTPPQATGRVTFYDGSTVLGVANLTNGNASFTTLLPSPGSRSLTARITGSTGLSPVIAPTLTQNVNPVPASTLQAGNSYATTGASYPVAVADFNGDGHLDIVTDNFNILFGNGDGTFRAPVVYSSPKNVTAVTTGDFNGDGKPDFAATDFGGNVEIWLNKGDGTFAAPVLIATTFAPIDIAASDFNHDGIIDLAIASRQNDAGIGILIGNGDGTFQPPKTFLKNQHENALAITDFNADGNPDIVAVSSDDYPNNVTVLLGVGDGTFRTSANYAASPQVVAVADFNRDGKPDFAVTGYNFNYIVVFLGNGDGTFTQSNQLAVTSGALPNTTKLIAADFDGDGISDLALATNSRSGVSVFIGNGDGTFRGAVNFPAGSPPPGSLIAAEFNGDGRTDLVLSSSLSVQILLGATGEFPTVTTTTVPSARGGVPYSDTLTANGGATPYTWSLSAGSLPDLYLSVSSNGVVAGTPPTSDPLSSPFSNIYPFSVVVSGPNGPGFYSGQMLALTLLPAFQINAIAANRNGKVGLPYTAQLAAAGGTRPFVNWKVVSGSLPPGLNLDPSSGLISGTPTQAGTFNITVTVDDSTGLTSLPAQTFMKVVPALSLLTTSAPDCFLGAAYYVVLQGTGGFPPYKNWTVASGALPPGLALDPTSGVISGTPTSATGSPFAVSITFSDGNTVSPPQALTINVSRPATVPLTLTSSANPSALGQPVTLIATLAGSSAKVTFYDGATVLGSSAIDNGKAQLTTNLLGAGSHNLFARSFAPSGSATLKQTVSAAPGFSFASADVYALGTAPSATMAILVADFNRDGKADIATPAYINNSNSIAILPGNGDGTFGKPIVSPTGPGPQSFLAADFNEDGIPDLVLNDIFEIDIWLGKGDGSFQTLSAVRQQSRIASFVTADFNLDGHSDLMLLDGSNQCFVLLGVGDGTFRPATTASTGLKAASAAVGDFNGDGIPDLVVADASSGQVNVLPGRGDGSFGSPVTLIASSTSINIILFSPTSVTTGDFNGDGFSDLLVAGPALDRFSVFLGRGNGTFSTPIDTPTGGAYLNALAIADINGDGINDVVLAGTSSFGALGVFLGTGDGTFRSTPPAAAGGPPLQLALGDFNGDGRTDVAFNTSKATVGVLLGSSSAGDQLSLSPAAVNIKEDVPNNPTQSITLILQTISSTPPPFSATLLGGSAYAIPTPASGAMTLASSSAGRYTWTAQVTIAFALSGTGSLFTEQQFQFTAGNAIALLPITIAIGRYPQATGIVNAGSGGQAMPSVVAPGSYIAIYGSNLSGPAQSATTLPLPTTLSGDTITLGGIAMPLLYAANGQVNAIVPLGLAPNGNYPMVIDYFHSQSPTMWLAVTELQPAIYTTDASGSGAGVVANATTGKLITQSSPTQAGDYLVIYGNGLGPLIGPNGEPQPGDGAAAPLSPIYHTKAIIKATIGGIDAPVLFSGLTPTLGYLYQVNIQVPSGVQPGSSVPLVITATDPQTGATGQSNTVTLAVR